MVSTWDSLPSMRKRIVRGRSPRVGIVLAAALVVAVGVPTLAYGVTYQGTGSYDDDGTIRPLAAEVGFATDVDPGTGGNLLVITLTNTSMADVFVPSQVLTGVFFELMGVGALDPVDAVVGPESTVLFTDSPPPVDISGEWAYSYGVDVFALGGDQGVGSSGLDGVFGNPDIIGGINLSGPVSPDGLQYGITSRGDDPTTGNAKVTGDTELVQDSVIVTLLGLPDEYSLDNIGKVWFQYGTSLDDPGYPGTPPDDPPGSVIPEPLTVASVFVAMAGLGAYVRRRSRG